MSHRCAAVPVSMLRRPNPAVAPIPLAVADARVDRDRVPPQTAAMMEGAAQLLTDGLAGFPLLGASPSPVPGHALAWRPLGAAAGAGVLRGRAGWGPSGGARGAFLSRAGRDLSRRRWISRSLPTCCFGFGRL